MTAALGWGPDSLLNLIQTCEWSGCSTCSRHNTLLKAMDTKVCNETYKTVSQINTFKSCLNTFLIVAEVRLATVGWWQGHGSFFLFWLYLKLRPMVI